MHEISGSSTLGCDIEYAAMQKNNIYLISNNNALQIASNTKLKRSCYNMDLRKY
jgi:hypothetical protein